MMVCKGEVPRKWSTWHFTKPLSSAWTSSLNSITPAMTLRGLFRSQEVRLSPDDELRPFKHVDTEKLVCLRPDSRVSTHNFLVQGTHLLLYLVRAPRPYYILCTNPAHLLLYAMQTKIHYYI